MYFIRMTLPPVASREDIKSLSGIIYLIRNKENGKQYVGKTIKTFYGRYPNWSWWKCISNKALKEDIAIFGPLAFEVRILEHDIPKIHLSKKEAFYALELATYYPNGYNIAECGTNNSCYRMSPEAREHRRMLHLKTYKVKHMITGEIVTITDVVRWCKENSIVLSTFRNVLCGLTHAHRNYCLPELDQTTIDLILTSNPNKPTAYRFPGKSGTVEDMDSGKIYEFTSISVFCKEKGLNKTGISHLLMGKIKMSQGFKLPESDICWRQYEATSPSGEVVKFYNLAEFSKCHGFRPRSLIDRERNTKGWSGLKIVREGLKRHIKRIPKAKRVLSIPLS